MSGNLNYYMMKKTHNLNFNGQDIQVSTICSKIISSPKLTLLKDSEPENIILKSWSYKYEFIKQLNIFINTIKLTDENNKKILNKNNICPYCGCELLKDKTEKNLFYYIPDVSYCFSPFIIHMMEIHDYKPPEKFIEYILLKSPFSYLKIKQDTAKFFEFFDGPNILSNYKFIDKIIGTLQHNKKDDKLNYSQQEYKDLIDPDQEDKETYIIPEFNYSQNKQYIETELSGTFIINNSYDKFFDIKKINVTNLTNDKSRQIFYGRVGTYFYSQDPTDKNKFMYHTHPDNTQGTKYIEDRIIKGNVLIEIFSLQDIKNFIYLLREPESGMYSSVIFTPEGIYQIMPSSELNPNVLIDEKIEAVYEEIDKFVKENNRKYKFVLFDTLSNRTYVKNDKFHNFIYRDQFYFDYLKKQLKLLGIDLIFYPKEMKGDGTWGYGDIYMPFDNTFKS